VTRRILEKRPVPIIIVTTDKRSEANPFTIIEAGAVAVVRTPAPPGHPEHEQTATQLLRTINALAGIDVRTNFFQRPKSAARTPIAKSGDGWRPECIGIGASTGGPQLLREIFAGLPSDYPIPIVVTQHLAKGFSGSMVKWLNVPNGLPIKIARAGQKLSGGTVYIAPDDQHVGVTIRRTIELSDSANYKNRPAVSYMFGSMAKTFGNRCVAILLSGMGSDGAAEMKELRDLGALTIAQDKESSLIHGMAGEAIARGAVCEVLNPERIIRRLNAIAYHAKNPSAPT
jgi:two-component system chemotaxis response regulator CheB